MRDPNRCLPQLLFLLLTLAAAERCCGQPSRSDGEKNVMRDRELAARLEQGRKLAVVIGIDRYLDPNIPALQFCGADAKALARALIDHGGFAERDVLVMTDDQERDHLKPFRINLVQQVRAWLGHAAAADTVVVFFSGHGFVDAQQQGFLAPKDCQRDRLEDSSLRTSELRDMLDRVPAKQKVLILDCCHAGAEKGTDPVGASSESLGSVFGDAKGLITLASCSQEETSREWQEKRQGLYTHFLVQGLAGAADYDRNGIVDSDELYKYVFENVPATAQRELNAIQHPVRIINAQVQGVFALARTRAVPPVTPPLPYTPGQQIVNSLGMKLAFIPPGEFEMGSPAGEAERGDDEKQHSVRITKPFFLGIHEVTQRQYRQVAGSNPSVFSAQGAGAEDVGNLKTDDFAVDNVNWRDAVQFCERLSRLPDETAAGRVYRLPTEAEWEYACRAGTATPFSFGASCNGRECNCDGTVPYGGAAPGPYLERTCEAGRYAPNRFGLCDMHGNVWEWCQDAYVDDYTALPRDDPLAAGTGETRVLRGGGWYNQPGLCRSAARNATDPNVAQRFYGFRVVCSPVAKVPE